MARNGWIVDGGWFLFWLAVSAAWCITAGRQIGPTFDEPYFITAGLESWRTGTAKSLIDTGAMPLPMYVTTAPLYAWERYRGQTLNPATEMGTMVATARLGTLVFWTLLLAYAMLAGRLLAGPWGGRSAVALIAAEPTFLAHASLATADIAALAFLLAFWVHFYLGRERVWGLRVGLPAFCFALGLFAKASVLPFAILGMGVLHLAARSRQPGPTEGSRTWLGAAWRSLVGAPFRRDLLQVTGLAFFLVFVLVGSDWKPSPSFQKWAASLPDGLAGGSLRWLADHLAIFSNAGNAIAYQIRHNMRGHSTYLLGTSYPRAVWCYFPVALSIKLTLSFLALPCVLAVLAPGALRNWACALAVLFLLFSLNCRVQTGVRFMLPLLTVTAICLAAALARAAAKAGPSWRHRCLVVAGVVAPLWAGWSSWVVWPHGLCYVNELWGGTATAYRLLCDSNYDWGQGVPELQAWAATHGRVDAWYFGTDPAIARPPLHVVRLHDIAGLRPDQVRTHCPARYLAVGTTILFSPLELWEGTSGIVQYLRQTAPDARTTTFLIFDLEKFPPPPPPVTPATPAAPTDLAAAALRCAFAGGRRVNRLEEAHAAEFLVSSLQQVHDRKVPGLAQVANQKGF
jgi:hypothetical protein